MTDPQTAADTWNTRYPIGTPVVAYPTARPEEDSTTERLTTRTRSEAQVLSGHTAVVWVHGHGARIALTHIDPVHSADTYTPPAPYRRSDGALCCPHAKPVGPGSCEHCWDLVKWDAVDGLPIVTGGQAPATDRATLRDRIAEALMQWAESNNSPQYAKVRRPDTVVQNAYSRADAVVAVLPAPAARAAVLEEAAEAVAADTTHIRYGSATDYAQRHAALLRRMAAESQQGGQSTTDKAAEHGLTDTEYRARSHAAAVATIRAAIPGMYARVGFRLEDVLNEAAGAQQQPDTEIVHGCPPDGSDLTPCCGKSPVELPRYDRMTINTAAVTCPGTAPAKEARP
ncbi:hypothetical protein [Streptomyces sp. NPDC088789]|uniref:hypothetical protein n=1 Tax=Streptomyces sp. NPDC088789 TaxID=3365899 RepID=UPI00382E160A